MIFEHLPRAYANGDDLEAREAMALAAFYAGLAFTKAYVGYVHAFSHKIGGMYGVPHGLANAITLPYVLDFMRGRAARASASRRTRRRDRRGQRAQTATTCSRSVSSIACGELNRVVGIPGQDGVAASRPTCRRSRAPR